MFNIFFFEFKVFVIKFTNYIEQSQNITMFLAFITFLLDI